MMLETWGEGKLRSHLEQACRHWASLREGKRCVKHLQKFRGQVSSWSTFTQEKH